MRPEDYFAAAGRLNLRYGCLVPFKLSLSTIDLGSLAANRLEGVIHEIAHALLLGLPLKRSLAKTVGNTLRQRTRWDTYTNETETIAVTTGVLRKMRVPFRVGDMLNENHSKVNSPMERLLGYGAENRYYDVEHVWRRFFRTRRYRETVKAVMDVFEKEVKRGKETE